MLFSRDHTATSYALAFVLALLLLHSPTQSQTTAITPSGDTVYLYNDGTYQKKSRSKQENRRLKATIQEVGKKYSASNREIETAYSLANQGWRYTLPQPKSPQAAWGNTDGRTTWWYGYWKNQQTRKFSSTIPKLTEAGIWLGDGQNMEGYYRRGGSPEYPTKLERILSEISH